MITTPEIIKKNLFAWHEELTSIIQNYKDSEDNEPLDGDEVDRLTEIIRAKINLLEGNITEREYLDMDFWRVLA